MEIKLFELITTLGHDFQSLNLLHQALTHKSKANEQSVFTGSPVPASPSGTPLGPPAAQVSASQNDNERLEFLGDAVLDLALSSCLMEHFPSDSEGALSKKRASLVNEDTLALIAKELGLEQLIQLGKGELKTGGLQKPRILASALEAIFGAVYMDGGFTAALMMTRKIYGPRIEELKSTTIDFMSDFKTRLQERAQELHRATPTYQVESERGPDHDKIFEVSVRLEGRALATGLGRSKKSAEQEAAKEALHAMLNEQKSTERVEV
jgi:ribonuclease-3